MIKKKCSLTAQMFANEVRKSVKNFPNQTDLTWHIEQRNTANFGTVDKKLTFVVLTQNTIDEALEKHIRNEGNSIKNWITFATQRGLFDDQLCFERPVDEVVQGKRVSYLKATIMQSIESNEKQLLLINKDILDLQQVLEEKVLMQTRREMLARNLQTLVDKLIEKGIDPKEATNAEIGEIYAAGNASYDSGGFDSASEQPL